MTNLYNQSNPPKNIRKIKTKIPYCCKNALRADNLFGMNVNSIQWPSSGGMGIKLNRARIIFILTIKENIKKRPGLKEKKLFGKNLISNPKNKAKTKLEMGPAMATLKEPHFWSLKLWGLTGTGFAQPKIGPCPAVAKSNNNGKITEPKGSKCFIGFKVSLP